MVTIGGVYQHYKGNKYMVLLTATIEATGEEAIVYQDMTDPDLVWIRPTTEREEYVLYEDIEIPRFTLLPTDYEQTA